MKQLNYNQLLKAATECLYAEINKAEKAFKVTTMKTEFGYSIWITSDKTRRTMHICRCEDAKTAYKRVLTFIDGYHFGYVEGKNK